MLRAPWPPFLLAALLGSVSCRSSTVSPRPTTVETGVPPADTGVPPTDTGVDATADAGSAAACVTSSECAWGEIDHEILSRTDCICLFGCPSLPLNRTTIERRSAQYRALCDPRTDGRGGRCPVDDCISPPPLVCRNGACTPGG